MDKRLATFLSVALMGSTSLVSAEEVTPPGLLRAYREAQAPKHVPVEVR